MLDLTNRLIRLRLESGNYSSMSGAGFTSVFGYFHGAIPFCPLGRVFCVPGFPRFIALQSFSRLNPRSALEGDLIVKCKMHYNWPLTVNIVGVHWSSLPEYGISFLTVNFQCPLPCVQVIVAGDSCR